jgi:hypothetical protein
VVAVVTVVAGQLARLVWTVFGPNEIYDAVIAIPMFTEGKAVVSINEKEQPGAIQTPVKLYFTSG